MGPGKADLTDMARPGTLLLSLLLLQKGEGEQAGVGGCHAVQERRGVRAQSRSGRGRQEAGDN